MSSIPDEALALYQEGRRAGSAGDYARALELLFHAHSIALDWPGPPYDMAYTYLLNDYLEEAEKWYAVVDKLAPRGFLMSKTFLDMVRRERSGDLPDGLSKAFAMLEWEPKDLQRKVFQQIVQRCPAFAPAWAKLAFLAEGDDAKLEALERGLAANPDDTTYIELVSNKVLLLGRRGQHAEAQRLRQELMADARCTEFVKALMGEDR